MPIADHTAWHGGAARGRKQRTASGGNQEGRQKWGWKGGIRHLTTLGVAKLQSVPGVDNPHYTSYASGVTVRPAKTASASLSWLTLYTDRDADNFICRRCCVCQCTRRTTSRSLTSVLRSWSAATSRLSSKAAKWETVAILLISHFILNNTAAAVVTVTMLLLVLRSTCVQA